MFLQKKTPLNRLSLAFWFAALKIIMYSSVFLLPTLIPLALTDDNIDSNKEANNATTKLDYLAMTNVKVRLIVCAFLSSHRISLTSVNC